MIGFIDKIKDALSSGKEEEVTTSVEEMLEHQGQAADRLGKAEFSSDEPELSARDSHVDNGLEFDPNANYAREAKAAAEAITSENAWEGGATNGNPEVDARIDRADANIVGR